MYIIQLIDIPCYYSKLNRLSTLSSILDTEKGTADMCGSCPVKISSDHIDAGERIVLFAKDVWWCALSRRFVWSLSRYLANV